MSTCQQLMLGISNIANTDFVCLAKGVSYKSSKQVILVGHHIICKTIVLHSLSASCCPAWLAAWLNCCRLMDLQHIQ